jgi:hypothetical protein
MELFISTVDHVRGGPDGRLIVEYGDYECPYSRRAFRAIQRVESQLGDQVRFAFRHFPLTNIHPHALAAAAAAEAAALQGRFWEMHELLFHRQRALGDADLRAYATELGLDLERFDVDRAGASVLGSAATSRAASPPARCSAPRRCSSTVWCIEARTTSPRYSRGSLSHDDVLPGRPDRAARTVPKAARNGWLEPVLRG